MLRRLLRLSIAIVISLIAYSVSKFAIRATKVIPEDLFWSFWSTVGGITALFFLIGFFVAPAITRGVVKGTKWLEAKLQGTPTSDIISGVIGVIVGLIIATLLGNSFSRMPYVGPYLPMIGSVLLGYLGWSIGTKKRDEIVSILSIFRIGSDKQAKNTSVDTGYKILDTSVIIDGRIADICKTGFLEGILLIPNFVLDELRHIADSSDSLKRNRGRRGLDILNKMQKESDIKVEIYEGDIEDVFEVDSKLVRLAQILGGQVVTNDYNLNKVAEFQGVKVLNINELSNAVKPVVLPGEEMQVHVIKEGKESAQGIAYLDDGTMIVVENGRKYLNQTIQVIVTSVLQTAAGRMIFAKPFDNGTDPDSNNDWKEVNTSA